MSQQRQLAAIMFTDIEGYTAFMQQDEQKAIALKDRHREVLQQEHLQFNGKIIQYYGDGTLSIFPSVVEAVRCALNMQQAFCKPPQVPVRIGLHSGDIIFDGDHIFGDGVNVASRIESLGMAGAVLISDKVNDELSNHPELSTILVGDYQFKNVNRVIKVFALDHEGLVKPLPGLLKGKTVDKAPSFRKPPSKSVAVLPFVNMSNDPEQEYFGHGIAEDILNSLSTLRNLKVAGPASSSRFNREQVSLREIGEQLGVSTVLEGSVRRQGNRLRITVQLLNVSDGFHLWSEKYDRNMDDIFAIQDEVALAVTEKLKITLLEKDKARITKAPTRNTEAYELYLKGRFHLNRRGSSIIIGMHFFQLAIDLDPDFALAYTGYADAGMMAALYGLVPPMQVGPKAKEYAQKALELDPSQAEPYCSLGFYYTVIAWDWEQAEQNFIKAIGLNPRYAPAHYWYGLNLLSWVKRDFIIAERHGRMALEAEPMSTICFGMYGAILHEGGEFERAITACNSGIAIDGNSFICHLYKGWAHLRLQQYDDAILCFSHLMKISNRHHFAQNALILTYCQVGKTDEARVLLDELKERSEKEYVGVAITALSLGYLGHIDEAIGYLEKAYNEREPILLTLRYEHFVADALKNDPRYIRILERMNFPERNSQV